MPKAANTASFTRAALLRAACAVAVLAAGSFPSFAQTAPRPAPPSQQAQAVPTQPARPGAAEDISSRRSAGQSEMEEVRRQMGLTDERISAIRDEIAGIRKDEQTLTGQLIQAAKTERKLAQDADAIGSRVEALSLQQDDLKGSLAERRGVLAEVLGALQRMGLNPPPAILVRPEDALASVRSAILLGAVVPEMRAQTEMLMADLTELQRLAGSIRLEREKLLATVAQQAAEQERLRQLVAEKGRLRGRSEEVLVAERTRAEELAARAVSLQSLIEGLEKEHAAVTAAERKAAEQALGRPVPPDNALSASLPFASLKSKLALPVSGRFGTRFAAPDGAGGTLMGDIVTTQSAAIVTAPAEGSVLYAGPFRSYGQLLILNAGDGYHVVLAGMGRINVTLGQTVLAGEPVGTMGEARLASAVSIGTASSAPELYVEFRKDGKPVDPAPWWAVTSSGRTTGNDS